MSSFATRPSEPIEPEWDEPCRCDGDCGYFTKCECCERGGFCSLLLTTVIYGDECIG